MLKRMQLRNLRHFLLIISLVASLGGWHVAMAQEDPLPLGLQAPPAAEFTGIAQGDLVVAIYRIINIFLALVGLIAVLYLIYGGVRYIASRGDSSETEEAKKTILYAIVGLIVIGLSAAVVRFVVFAINLA